MFGFTVDNETLKVICHYCSDKEDPKTHNISMGEIPDGIFKCSCCEESFLVYDGRLFMEYKGFN